MPPQRTNNLIHPILILASFLRFVDYDHLCFDALTPSLQEGSVEHICEGRTLEYSIESGLTQECLLSEACVGIRQNGLCFTGIRKPPHCLRIDRWISAATPALGMFAPVLFQPSHHLDSVPSASSSQA